MRAGGFPTTHPAGARTQLRRRPAQPMIRVLQRRWGTISLQFVQQSRYHTMFTSSALKVRARALQNAALILTAETAAV